MNMNNDDIFYRFNEATKLAYIKMVKMKRMYNTPLIVSIKGVERSLDPFTVPDKRDGNWENVKEMDWNPKTEEPAD